MYKLNKSLGLATLAVGAALIASLATSAHAGEFIATGGDAAQMRFSHVMNIGSKGTGKGQFKYVEDFALTDDGNLLATDAAHAWVQVFDKKTGKFITRFGGKGDGEANLTKPEGISVDPNGNIFVADYTTGDVKVYDKNYKWLKTFSEYGSAPGQNIKSEFTDVRFGRYYMPEAGNHRISDWDLNGKFLFTWGKKGSGPGEFKAPAGIAIDKDDNIYVSEIGNNRVQVFDKTGKFLTMWGKKGSGTGEFGNLHGIYCDKSTGWIYVADTANNRIQVFKPAG